MSALPRICADLPGSGGHIKAQPAHFVVEELPLYEPCGAGEHVYLRHRRELATTDELVKCLARTFALRPRDIGCAGLKDKHALAEQTFSLPLPRADPREVQQRAQAALGGQVLWARRHGNKLRRGHLLGNRFTVVITDCPPGALERALAVAAALESRGLPNFYGEQRLGQSGRNARRGRESLSDPRQGFLLNLHRTAWQAELFNRWLLERLDDGLFARLLSGDVAKRLDNGALFDVDDEAAEQARLEQHEITPTGPLFGSGLRSARGLPGEREQRVLLASGVSIEQLEASRLLGSRRAARIFAQGLSIEPDPEGLRLCFALPKGSYATRLLAEIMDAQVETPDLDESL